MLRSYSLQGHLENGHQEGRQLDLGCFGLPGTFNVFPEGWRCTWAQASRHLQNKIPGLDVHCCDGASIVRWLHWGHMLH